MKREHGIRRLLIKLGVSTKNSFKPFYPRTRERADVSVFRCNKSGVITLSIDEVPQSHYEHKLFNGRGARTRAQALQATAVDSARRANQFGSLINKKRWLDVGTGAGGILDALSPRAKSTEAVELQDESRESLEKLGYTVHKTLQEVESKPFDVVSFFHVLEHLPHPLEDLQRVRQLLTKGGKVVIEVPHAKDVLITLYESDAFKAHTFWHEHLLLHTKESLHALLKAAGFKNIKIEGFQRYPLANHLHWLAKGKPGGQNVWPQLRDAHAEKSYTELLEKLGATDTLVAVATK